MSFNTFGKLFRFTTWGESHGPAIGCIVDGCPPNVNLIEQDMAPFGFVDDGVTDPLDEETIDEYGDRWIPVVRKNH